jgi:hypothetical protein
MKRSEVERRRPVLKRTAALDEQARLHAAAAETLGKIASGNSHRSIEVRATVRRRLAARRAR